MAQTWPPFSGDQNKRFAYSALVNYLSTEACGLSKKKSRDIVGIDWVYRKLEFGAQAKYHSRMTNGCYEEVWVIPFRRNTKWKNLKKYANAAVANTLTAADTALNPIPPGTHAPGAKHEIDKMNPGTNVSTHLYGGTDWTDMLAWIVGSLDADTRAGRKIVKEELGKLVDLASFWWGGVMQITPIRPIERKVFRRAQLRVGPSDLVCFEQYQSGRGFPLQGYKTYKRSDTDPDNALAALMRLDRDDYDVRDDPEIDDDAFYTAAPR